MRIRLISICVLLGFLLSSCAEVDPAGMLWKVYVGGETIFPGSQAIYVRKINEQYEKHGGLQKVNIKNGKISWKLKIVSDEGQLTFVEAEMTKYELQLDTYPGDRMVKANLTTNVEGYDEQSGVVFVKTDEQSLDSSGKFQRLYAIRLNDGQILWKVGLDSLQTGNLGFIVGSFYIQDGLVGFTTLKTTGNDWLGITEVENDAELNLYDAATGKIWSEKLVDKENIYYFPRMEFDFMTILREGQNIYLS